MVRNHGRRRCFQKGTGKCVFQYPQLHSKAYTAVRGRRTRKDVKRFQNGLNLVRETFKLEKRPTDKAKKPDPGGSDQQNLAYKQLKNRKTDRTVGLKYKGNIRLEI